MRLSSLLGAGLIAAALLVPAPALAHCDGLDGPVVAAARKALSSGDPNTILIWVQPKDEAQVRHASPRQSRSASSTPKLKKWPIATSSKPWCACIALVKALHILG